MIMHMIMYNNNNIESWLIYRNKFIICRPNCLVDEIVSIQKLNFVSDLYHVFESCGNGYGYIQNRCDYIQRVVMFHSSVSLKLVLWMVVRVWVIHMYMCGVSFI